MKRSLHIGTIILFYTLWVFGCSKGDDSVEWHSDEFCNASFTENRFPLPAPKSFDLNGDGIDDIEIFQEAHIVSTAFEDSRISTFMKPLRANRILIRPKAGIVDQGHVMHMAFPELFWTNGEQILARVSGCNGLYQKNWQVANTPNKSTYRGIIINNKGVAQIVWMKLDINLSSGDVQLIDFEFSNDSSIVVGEH